MSLHPVKLGVAAGIVVGASIFIVTILSMYTGYADRVLYLLTDVYPGYRVSWLGSIIGLLYGFADAFLAFFLIGWIYNKLLSRDRKL
jgi:hypothetical protein